ncbi:hypothetical protein [Leifsonia sp. fls2-241-R2A-40a]|uniref:hypothetical protein n=1 Tax=Leifsonia sp. fls2-241-R2A-40a TaxID=3040290 RepID=UPI00254EDD5F|nr:hypothetical protein [Leifsonia sp. fls2-241-R2A-40a]
MSTVTRTADPTGGAAVTTAAAGAVTVDGPSSRSLTGDGLPDQPVVVIDLVRAAHRFRELREAVPWADPHFDVSALAHPELIRALAADGAGFTVSHPAALTALRRAGADPERMLYAVPGAPWHDRREAWDAGIRRFVVEDLHELDPFAAAPTGTSVLLAMPAESAPAAARRADALGIRAAGLLVRLDEPGAPGTVLQQAVRTAGAIAAETGRPFDVVATAGQRLVADCITIVFGLSERSIDALSASACIDAGAEVVVLRDGLSARTRSARTRPVLRGAPRPSRARITWSPVG